jgi:prolyl-tRNA synthetase
MRAVRGVEVGNIFKLGTEFSEMLGCYYLDAQGQSRPVIMGSYGIGVGRLLGCLAELHHDDQGLIWPISVAPFQVHLVALTGRGGSITLETAERLYELLRKENIEVLYDDRQESPGVKFNDADLIGLPIRLTVSERALTAGGIEYKQRDQTQRYIVPEDKLVDHVHTGIRSLFDELSKEVD